MNNDLISRSALKEATRQFADSEGFNPVHQIIDNAPTVELTESEVQEVLNKRCMTAVANEYLIALHGKTERPQGEWIEDYTAKKKRVVACNKCHCLNILGKSNFCPNCGAKMKGGAE